VFVRTNNAWSQQAYVKASNTGVDDQFGEMVALSADGSTLAVGVRREDSAATGIGGDQADDAEKDAGAMYVFIRTNNAWSQQAYVKASNTGAGHWFGRAVALSADGNVLAAGGGGAAYVFERTNNVWSQQANFKASNTESGDGFGSRLALSSDGYTLAVTAPGEASSATGIGGDQADNAAKNSGAAYVFVRMNNAWSQQAYVKASNTAAGDYFGDAVALSGDGNTLAVGASWEDSGAIGINGDQANNAAIYAGAGYVFVRTNNTWSQKAYVKASNAGGNDYFGYEGSIALSADGYTLAVGAYNEDGAATGIGGAQDNNAGAAGSVYVY
jgi:HJR/Mrr/RecB family endonuclease